MAKQIPSTPSNKKISEIYHRIKGNTLILQPEFQRKLVWTSAHKAAFIDTILKGLPFPEIYIAQSGIDIQKVESREVIVDGQQRLSTIVQYIDEKDNTKVFGQNTFGSLDENTQRDFLNYDIVVRDLKDIEPDMIRDIFKRINQTKFNLKEVEIQNAIYDGEFISTAKEILNSVENEHIPIFNESELSRMADLQFILSVMATLENGGYFTRDKEIDRMIVEYNDSYDNAENMKSNICSLLHNIQLLTLEPDSMWYRKSNFFTLVVELSKVTELDIQQLRGKLLEFESNILGSKSTDAKTDYSVYYGYMYTGTNNRQARVERGRIFSEHILSDV